MDFLHGEIPSLKLQGMDFILLEVPSLCHPFWMMEFLLVTDSSFLMEFFLVVNSLVHGLLRIIRRRYFPRKIALCKSLTQVRDRRLGFKKLNKSKNSSNLDILIPSKFDGFVVSSIWMEVMRIPIKSGECWLYSNVLE